MPQHPGPEQEGLAALVGRWRTEGWTTGTDDAPPARIDAWDTYEWLPGRFAVLHTVDARVGDEHVEGAEIVGWDPTRGVYVTQYFGSDGANAYEASLAEKDGALTWRMRSRSDRFTGTFSDDRNTIDGHWETLHDDNSWQPWMKITLTRDST